MPCCWKRTDIKKKQNSFKLGLSMRLKMALALFVLFVFNSYAAETLPSQLSDAEYWKLISDFSEPNGYFEHPIVTSNETSYQYVLPELMKNAKPGGVYLG